VPSYICPFSVPRRRIPRGSLPRDREYEFILDLTIAALPVLGLCLPPRPLSFSSSHWIGAPIWHLSLRPLPFLYSPAMHSSRIASRDREYECYTGSDDRSAAGPWLLPPAPPAFLFPSHWIGAPTWHLPCMLLSSIPLRCIPRGPLLWDCE
jgi:hypothetical protein